MTDSGHRLHASALKRTVSCPTLASGRWIHDLRHTAACMWLAMGVDPATVQAWMGHSSIATTNIYLHHLGTGADQAGLDRLNRRGTHGAHVRTSPTDDRNLIHEEDTVSAGQTRCADGGAEGIRTPDLLIGRKAAPNFGDSRSISRNTR